MSFWGINCRLLREYRMFILERGSSITESERICKLSVYLMFSSHLNRSLEWETTCYSPSSLFNPNKVTTSVYRKYNLIMSVLVAHVRWVCLTWKSTVWLRSCSGPWWWCLWSWWACSTLLAVGTCRFSASCCSSLKLCPLGAISNVPHSVICLFWTLYLQVRF